MPRPPVSRALRPLLAALLLAACRGDADQAEGGESGGAAPAQPAAGAPAAGASTQAFVLTEADLDAYERGLQQEIELVRAAQRRADTASTPESRSQAMQAQWKEQTMAGAASAIGMPADRYQQVRETVHEVLQTLDFQGKIEGPMQMDMSRAAPEVRARLERDPMKDLPPAVATALQARLDRLAPIFAQYVRLTAVGG